ncbi:MAG: universal stress protein [Luteibaculaceae bacterium]
MDKKILVPIDFSSVTLHAAKQACILAKKSGALVVLHHVSEKLKKTEKSEKLIGIAKELAYQYSLEVETIITEGTIFDDIGIVSSDEDASLVVMGTHGLQGLQLLTGSKALKVIANCNCPFLVTQSENALVNNFTSIIVPVSRFKPSESDCDILVQIAKQYQAELHFVSPKLTNISDSTAFKESAFLYQRLAEIHDINYQLHLDFTSLSQFENKLIQLAKKLEANLIAIINLQDIGFFNLPGNSFEQHIITNQLHIPVLVINPS